MAAKGKAPRIKARRSIAELETELLKRTAERDEALEQQAATAQVLQVINSSPGDLAPVFDAILEKAVRLCGAAYGNLLRYDGQLFSVAAAVHPDGQLAERALSLDPFPPAPGGPLDRIVHGEEVNAAGNIQESAGYRTRAEFREMADRSGYRGLLNVALRKEGTLLGAITVFRKEAGTFSEEQIALLQNFATQAVIAIENARLITETREALEQQTATAEVLQVINSSPGDLAPVFDAILEKAHSLCGAEYGVLLTYDGELFWPAAMHGAERWTFPERREGIRPGFGFSGLVSGERFLHIPDMAEIAAQRSDDPVPRALVENGIRTQLAVPLRNDGKLLGIITANRREVRPFTEKQIALLENFAAQAVIAMENARLLTETREALERQTATAEILRVISSSPADLRPTFDAIAGAARALTGASLGSVVTYDGRLMHVAALAGFTPGEIEKIQGLFPIPADHGTATGRAILTQQTAHIEDLAADPEFAYQTLAQSSGRTVLAVPMLRDRVPIGAINVQRRRAEPFTDKQIDLIKTFADQAVIAMENARLITETREALEQQTATAEVLGVINSSPGNLAPVFDAILEKAHALCGATMGGLAIFDGEQFRFVAAHGLPEFVEHSVRPSPNGNAPLDQLTRGEPLIHLADVRAADAYREVPRFRSLINTRGVRTFLVVPLRKDGALLGAIGAYRQEVRPFSDKQIALLQNFAAQAVIAIENVRLLDELRQRTDEVAELNRGLEARVTEQVEELGRVGRLKRFLAPQLAELIVSQGDEKILESHRREIVVVFCDLRGYTAFTETAEPEEVLDFLREYHGALGPLVSQFEGTLDQFSGDGIMVFFNDPVPCPDPAERAVRMAIAMREAAGTLIADWRERGRDLGFGAGIAQGYATLGQIGFSERSGYTAIGTVCNVAARLCAEAKDGQILLSQLVNVALKGSVATEQLGPLALKGLTQPVVAYNVPVAAIQPALRVIEGGPQSV